MSKTWTVNKEAGTMWHGTSKPVKLPKEIAEAIKDIPDVSSVSISVSRHRTQHAPCNNKHQEIYYLECLAPAKDILYSFPLTHPAPSMVKVRARITTKTQAI